MAVQSRMRVRISFDGEAQNWHSAPERGEQFEHVDVAVG